MNYQQSTVRVLEEIEAELYDEAIVQQYLDAVGEANFSEAHLGIYMAGIKAQQAGRPVTQKQHNGIKATHAKITKWLEGKSVVPAKKRVFASAQEAAKAAFVEFCNEQDSPPTQLDRIEALLTDIRDALRTGLGGAQ